MVSEILISKSLRETRIARLENGQLVEINIEREKDRGLIGNIYLGQVSRVLPGMQAAFLEIGLDRTAFLYVSNILDPNRKEEEIFAPETQFENDQSTDSSESENENSESVDDVELGEKTTHEIRPPNPIPYQKREYPNITTLIREGEKVLVQVVKEPMGTKGARLTGYLSLPGRYLVYLPETKHLGISRRITSEQERDRLRSIVDKNRPAQGGFIVRTVAEGASEKNIKDDMEYLVKLWGSVKKSVQKQTLPGLIYSELDLTMKMIRDRVTDDIERIVVDDLQTFKQITKFTQSFLPRFKKRIELYTGKTTLFEHHGLESEIKRAIARKVWLKSGGYIVIDETEALTSIDVNTGRFVGKRNLEDTILQTNLEALKEIAYQIRLRNLGGIIVLDFIDMIRSSHRERIYSALVEELKKDPVRTNILPISELGLIEMTRKRNKESLRQQLTSPCQYCEGRGYLRSLQTVSYQILRDIEKEIHNSPEGHGLTLYVHPRIAEFFTEEDRPAIDALEKKFGRHLIIKVDTQMHFEEYEIFSRDI
jgi:ribonuclease G